MKNEFEIDAIGFGLRLSEARRLFNVKQQELANYMDVTRPRISSAENGTSSGLTFIKAVKKYFADNHDFDKSFDYWIEGVENNNSLKNSSLESPRTEIINLYKSRISDLEMIVRMLEEKIENLEKKI